MSEIKPIAKVINNNQPGWTNIVETEPNVTLNVGTELYLGREDAAELVAPAVSLIRKILEKQSAAVLQEFRKILDEQSAELSRLTRENEVLRVAFVSARNELAGVGPDSSKEFHGMGICSALSIIESALKAKP